MAHSSPTSRRARRTARTGLFVLAVLAGAACTPHQQIAVLFNGNAESATRVANCESRMDPNAVSPTNDHGLFQINAVHRGDFERVTGQPWAKVYDSYWNTYYAKWLFDRKGWGPWTCRYVA